jgi:TIR domain
MWQSLGGAIMQGFISYSHHDADRVEQLRRHLHPVTRTLGIDLWIDESIHSGENWDRKIKEALDRAKLFLFCISSDLLFSKYVDQIELREARSKCDRGEALMVPVILRDCTWEWVRVFAELQAVPKSGRAIQLWTPQDTGYADASRRIGAMLKDHVAGAAP